MAAPVYLGDETSAAGYALAGVDARVPERGREAEALADARAAAPLVIVAADVAARLDPRVVLDAARALAPLVLVVPDLAGAVGVPDLAQAIRRDLGLEDAP